MRLGSSNQGLTRQIRPHRFLSPSTYPLLADPEK
jgi:hypothetical protein